MCVLQWSRGEWPRKIRKVRPMTGQCTLPIGSWMLFSFQKGGIGLCQLEDNDTLNCDIVARAYKENREIRYFIEVGMVFA